MYRMLLITSFLRSKLTLIVRTAVLTTFAVIIFFAVVSIEGLKTDLKSYQTQVMVLNDKVNDYETAAQQNDVLTSENSQLQEKNDALNDENGALKDENDNLAAANDELERQNGDLLKKYNGLSKPA